MGGILIVAILIWSILPLFICYSLAGRKGKSRALWLLLGIIFGWVAVLFIAIAAPEK
jgi:hypothetical protein